MIGEGKLWNRLLIVGTTLTVSAYPVASWAEARLNQIPQPPIAPPAPHGPLLYYALFNWFWTALIIVLLVREAWRTRSAFPLAFLAGGALAAFVEPIFDGNIHVLFVYPPGTHPSWHFYNVPYPWYEFAGNSCLAGPIYWMYHKFRGGVTVRELWAYFFISWAVDAIQELPGTAMGAYIYYGPQPFVVANWPVWVGMLAGLGYPLAGYAAYAMRDVMTGARLWLAQVVLMPVVIYGCEVIAWPMWDTLNGGQNLLVTRVAALVSLAFTATAYYVLILVYGRTQVGRRKAWQGSEGANLGVVNRPAEVSIS
jgi:hypothetical protein